MNRIVLGSLSGVSLAFLVAACSSDPAPDDGQAGAGGTGSGAAAGKGGSGKGGTGGTAGSSTGATGGTTASGTGGTGQAGMSGSVGGSNATGGTGTGATGATGGSGGSGVGGTGTVGGESGSAGSATGGSPDPGTGGVGPMGGSGGDAPIAGSSGSAGAAPAPEEPKVVTTGGNAPWMVGTLTEVTSGSAEVTVNDSAKQTWSGFGGTFNEKGWDALGALSEADRAKAIKLLFDAVDGAKFTYGRIPIGSSDYANNRYSLNGTANDATQANFSIDRDKQKLIPYIKSALGVNPDIHFWGSPWSPPPWMKDNNAYDRGNMRDDATVLGSYAIYLAKFVEEYAKEGIAVKEIHPQNEPGFGQDYPSCLWSGALMAKFISQYLGPTFEERNVPASIFIGTMSNSSTDGTVLTTVQGNAAAKAFVKGYGLQWGMLDTYSSLNMDTSLQIWQTEHKCGNYPWMGGYQSKAPNDHAYAVESWGLLRDWIRKGVNAYSAWNMVLDDVGLSLDTVRPWAQNALLAVNVQSKRLIITDTYYVFRHFSQYVDVGAKVVGVSGGDAVAFKNPDGTVVLVMYNSGGAKMSTVSIGGKLLQFNMPGNGWATVNWKAP